MGTACRALVAIVAVCAVSAAHAHDVEHHRVGTDKLNLTASVERPEKNGFSFKSSKQIAINALIPDPKQSATSLRVRVFGAAPGDSGFARLDPARWRAAGTAGWRYKGVRGVPSDRGIRKVLLKQGASGGRLVIRAKGELWPLPVEAAVGAVEVALVVGGHTICAETSIATAAEFLRNEAGRVSAREAEPPADCVAACGDGILDPGEACDDGNDSDEDTCGNDCEVCPSNETEFSSTYAALQARIFDDPAYVCSTPLCHGSASSGGLSLAAADSYAALVGVASTADPSVQRVFPGDEDRSLLYLKLAASTLGEPSGADLPGSPMPIGPTSVDESRLEALRTWIRAGAPADGVVAGTAQSLDTCLAAPTPAEVPRPDAPPADEGFQLAMAGWPLAANSETELCVATYYDLTAPGLVPPAVQRPCPAAFPGTNEEGASAGLCVTFDRQLIVQDSQAHHLNAFVYSGEYDHDDPGWGVWRCFGGGEDGAMCDPTVASACAPGVCASETSAGGLCGPPNFGPPDLGAGGAAGFIGVRFLGTALEPVAETAYPANVFGILPMRGIVVWNSHAFNVTNADTSMDAWINHYYATDPIHVVEPLFATDYLYTQDVPPFEQREYCATQTFADGSRAFSFRSHYHKRGRRFRVWGPPQTPCPSGGPAPNGYGLATDPACTPGDPADLIYESFANDDPLHLVPDPPLLFSGDEDHRTVKYCALYDNGATAAAEVKRASTSIIPFSPTEPGGPCAPADRRCLGGANIGVACFGDDLACPGSVCDACNLRGGVTTDDEMFGLEVYIFNTD